ncbi:Caspase-2 [Cryptotermes secundus]|nr:caspase-2 isoform X2 [Cryptotermes secundus]PNF19850.1 Caspase-2 [Cryptotermes secundus]
MNEEDRQKIVHNLVELVAQTNLDTLLPELLQKGVFTLEMGQKYMNNSVDLLERKRQLYLDLQTRGPEAFQHLIVSLMKTGHLDLVQQLQPGIDLRSFFLEQVPRNVAHVRQGTAMFIPPNYAPEDDTDLSPRLRTLQLQIPHSVANLSQEPLKVVVKKATMRKDICTPKGLQVYPMSSKPRGYFFMINNVEFVNNIFDPRKGSLVDEENLHELFREFGYIVESHRNQGLEDMKRKIREFAQRREHSLYDSCVVAIMSHGNMGSSKQDSVIIAANGQYLEIEWVLEQFTNENAPSLQARPKIFFFQTCRGDGQDFGVKLTSGRIKKDGSSSSVLRSMSDMLIGYSTLPGFSSNRDIHLGTWYIQAICEVFMEHACDTDVEDMLKLVDQKLATLTAEDGSLQTSSYENRGFRKLYFNPGLFDPPSGYA